MTTTTTTSTSTTPTTTTTTTTTTTITTTTTTPATTKPTTTPNPWTVCTPGRLSFLGVTQARTGQTGALLQAVTVDGGSVVATQQVADLSRVINPTSSSPNALAYAGDFAYAASLAGTNSKLYRITMATGAVSYVGELIELAGGAAYLNGSYWYAVARSDRLRRVSFGSAGNLLSDTIVAAFSGSRQELFDYGDLDFLTVDTLIVAATKTVASTTIRVLFTYNLATSTFTEILSSPTSVLSQITVRGGVVYNHHTVSGNWSTVSLNGEFSSPLFVTAGYTDVSAVPCFAPPVTPSATTTTTSSTTTTTTTATAAPTSVSASGATGSTAASSPTTLTTTPTITVTTTPSILPACPLPVGTSYMFGVAPITGDVALLAFALGSGGGGGGGGSAVVTRLGSVSAQVTTTSSSPNALAYDPVSTNLYLASFSGTYSRLYRMDIATRGVSFLGNLADLAGGATFFAGSYWYASQRSDRIRRVDFDSQGAMLRDVLVASMASGLRLFDYGDIAFANARLLVLSVTEVSSAGAPLAKRLATFDVVSQTLTIVRSLPTAAALSQITLDSHGTLFNHNTTTGLWTTLNLTGDVTATLATTAAYSDVSAFLCADLNVDLFPTTTTTTTTTSTTTSTTSTTTTSTTTAATTISPSSMATTGSTPTATTSTTTSTTTVQTTTPAPTPAYLACPPTAATIFGVTLANQYQTGGNLVAVTASNGGVDWDTVLIGSVSSVVTPTSTSPNALAYAPATRELYFASFSGKFSKLYKYNLLTKSITSLGDLAELAGGATFFNGTYWYAAQRADRLRRVTISATTGRVVSDVVVANMTGGTRLWDYGDLDFLPNGTLAIGANSVFANGTVIAREFAMFTPGPNTLRIVRSSATAVFSQVAVSGGVVYNHQSSTGLWTTIDAASGQASDTLYASLALTDVAGFRCP